MNKDDEDDILYENVNDVVATAIRGATGVVPFVGTALGEVLTLTVPKQRLDRVAHFSRQLSSRITEIEQKQLCQNKYFVDLVEDAVVQASKSLSDDRNMYLAVFLEQNKHIDENDHSIKKKLLYTLQEMTDDDIKILRTFNYVADCSVRQSDYFAGRVSIKQYMEWDRNEQYQYDLRKETWDAHLATLVRLKVLTAKYVVPRRAKMERDGIDESDIYDEETGLPSIDSHQLSSLGQILLRSIGIYEFTSHELTMMGETNNK